MDKSTEQLKNLELCAEGADKVRALVKKPGWKLIEEYLEILKNQYLNVLKTERNLDKIYYAQAVINVIESLSYSINASIYHGDEADKQIKEIKKKIKKK
ncbi:MAG: hypothetical protein E3J83_04375 [Candidatus Atribacteria bacterium]|nr:MAG: hypothetical protein E3J83_04375 [Candidatus Atribacteria bacterium]